MENKYIVIKSNVNAENLVDSVIPCRLCGTETTMLGTKLCDRCWELEHRINADLLIAKKIISSITEFDYIKDVKRLIAWAKSQNRMLKKAADRGNSDAFAQFMWIRGELMLKLEKILQKNSSFKND